MPNKQNYVVIDHYNRNLTIKFKDKIIAQSENAMILKEVSDTVYTPVMYFPKEDVKVELELVADRTSTCSLKGKATYWKIKGVSTDHYFAWSYDAPLAAAEKIKGYVSFSMDYITIISVPIE